MRGDGARAERLGLPCSGSRGVEGAVGAGDGAADDVGVVSVRARVPKAGAEIGSGTSSTPLLGISFTPARIRRRSGAGAVFRPTPARRFRPRCCCREVPVEVAGSRSRMPSGTIAGRDGVASEADEDAEGAATSATEAFRISSDLGGMSSGSFCSGDSSCDNAVSIHSPSSARSMKLTIR